MAIDAAMKIESIYVYPVKSLRGVSLNTSTLTRQGFPYDRTYMLLQVVDDEKQGGKTFKNMSIANNNEMCRFFPAINTKPDGEDTMTITFHPVNGDEPKSIDIPLTPDTTTLEEIDVIMHLSPTKAYKMSATYNEWFTSCFGYDCVLAYISDNLREVRMSSTKYKDHESEPARPGNSWLSSISSLLASSGPEEVDGIRFSDVAPYLFVSSKSMDDIDRRLPEGEEFDITKFRPNVIISGSQQPWDEDYWSELTIGDDNARVEVEHNCGRCRSINIDYNTGAQGTGEAGKMLKKLASDRRVDKGTKWSPIFGRYAFLHPSSEGKEVSVGQVVRVTRQNKERTDFDWRGLSTLPGGGRE